MKVLILCESSDTKDMLRGLWGLFLGVLCVLGWPCFIAGALYILNAYANH